MASSILPLRPRAMAALAASCVGTWEYDPVSRTAYLDPLLAPWFGLAAQQGASGVSLNRVLVAMRQVDGAPIDLDQRVLRRDGSIFVYEFRAFDRSGTKRSVLARGRFEPDADGKPVFARGVMLDITGDEEASQAVDAALLGGLEDGEDEAVLGRAIDQTLAVHQSIKELGPHARASLPHLTELLLHELGVQLAAKTRER